MFRCYIDILRKHLFLCVYYLMAMRIGDVVLKKIVFVILKLFYFLFYVYILKMHLHVLVNVMILFVFKTLSYTFIYLLYF